MRISFNAPVTLIFAILCTFVLALDKIFLGSTNVLFTMSPGFDFRNWVSYFTSFSYVFGHADINHLMGNMAFILLLGPVLEERYGAKHLLIMMAITTLATSIFFYLFFNERILGASGIVFMFIVLTSFANRQKNTIPLTFILVCLIFLGQEVVASLSEDNVSQTAHLAGGALGGVFGLFWFR
ncbi:MAG: rhomboid family intramembrane serine protease [Bacteroidetes bacterium]|nr:rhomboid family intramembrane serine protease [Bacteroidota bacterium]